MIADCILSCGYKLVGYMEKSEKLTNPLNLTYLGKESIDLIKQMAGECKFFPAVGSNALRKSIISLLDEFETSSSYLKHPTSFLSSTARCGAYSFISANAVVNSFAKIGDGGIINTGSVVEHECQIGDFAHIAPGAVLAGNVSIGESSFVGANAVVKQGVKVGKNVIVGAGSVVLKDIGDGEVWVGNPAKRLR